MDESRKQFEEWLKYSGLHKFVDMKVQNNGVTLNEYMDWDMQLAFRAWKASRESFIKGWRVDGGGYNYAELERGYIKTNKEIDSIEK